MIKFIRHWLALTAVLFAMFGCLQLMPPGTPAQDHPGDLQFQRAAR